jgi:hypothetical protein
MSKSRIILIVVLGLLVVSAQVPAARADFTFGKRVDLEPAVNSPVYKVVIRSSLRTAWNCTFSPIVPADTVAATSGCANARAGGTSGVRRSIWDRESMALTTNVPRASRPMG